MRAFLPGRPERFRDDRELPALLRVVRAQMRERYGPEFGQPWPQTAAAAQVQIPTSRPAAIGELPQVKAAAPRVNAGTLRVVPKQKPG